MRQDAINVRLPMSDHSNEGRHGEERSEGTHSQIYFMQSADRLRHLCTARLVMELDNMVSSDSLRIGFAPGNPSAADSRNLISGASQEHPRAP